MMGEIALPRNCLLYRVFLVSVLTFSSIPSMAMAKEGPSRSDILEYFQRHPEIQRRLEEFPRKNGDDDFQIGVGDEESPLEGGDAPVDDFVDPFFGDDYSMNMSSQSPLGGGDDFVDDFYDDDYFMNMSAPDPVDRNGDGIAYNPCSLCQGLDVAYDRVANEELLGFNITCGEYAWYMDNMPELFVNSIDTCRGDQLFNVFFEACCEPSIPYYKCEQNVHKYLAEEDYNTAVPPIVSLHERLNVTFDIQYQALEDISVEDGTASIYVSIRMSWKDERLSWDVDDNTTCANLVTEWTGHEVEKTGIWLPDFQLLNEIEGTQTMPDYKAHVYADGTVRWGFDGGLKAFCAFRNLANIPFDTLGCQLLFGAGTRDYTQLIRYSLQYPDSLMYGVFEDTYNEWTVVPELGEQGMTFEDEAIYYNIYFKRATRHYLQNIVVPTTILTYLSFFTFLLDMRVGERLGFGMALALVVVAQQIVTSGMTPISNQILWLDRFVACSFYWVLIGVIESVLIGFLFFVRQDAETRNEKEMNSKDSTQDESGDLADINKEELEPLTMEAADSNEEEMMKMEEDNRNDVAFDSPGEPSGAASEPSDNDATVKKKNWFKELWNAVIYKIPLRKLDMFALGVSVTTYSLFVLIMFITGETTNVWLRNEPVWFHEDTNMQKLYREYVNGTRVVWDDDVWNDDA